MASPAHVLRPLEDRAEAGRRLASALERYRAASPTVLGIPRGGVAVAFEIASRLACPLDVLLVRKVGAPGDPEYGLGAVAEGGLVRIDEARAREAGYSRSDLEPIVRQELAEIADRANRFRGTARPPSLTGRTVIVVDDGVATGGTISVGIEAVRLHRPRTVVVALGVAPASALPALRRVADDVVVALAPEHLEAVGQWYRHFAPVEDAEVARWLVAARPARPKDAR